MYVCIHAKDANQLRVWLPQSRECTGSEEVSAGTWTFSATNSVPFELWAKDNLE